MVVSGIAAERPETKEGYTNHGEPLSAEAVRFIGREAMHNATCCRDRDGTTRYS